MRWPITVLQIKQQDLHSSSLLQVQLGTVGLGAHDHPPATVCCRLAIMLAAASA